MSLAASDTPPIEDLVARYHAGLRDRTVLKQVRNWTEITTPFLDRHNDCIQIYARREDTGILLTDDGHTLTDLEMSGCNLDSPKRREMLRTTLGQAAQLGTEAAIILRDDLTDTLTATSDWPVIQERRSSDDASRAT